MRSLLFSFSFPYKSAIYRHKHNLFTKQQRPIINAWSRKYHPSCNNEYIVENTAQWIGYTYPTNLSIKEFPDVIKLIEVQ